MRFWLLLLLAATTAGAQQLSEVRRICVDELAGDRSAAQIRDMIIAALHQSKRFAITENCKTADATLRGSAEDLVFTDTFQTSDSLTARASVGGGFGTRTTSRIPQVAVGENESQRITERKHEAFASVRLVNKDGDVVWSTTQESLGAKFRGASADVADKVCKQLLTDLDKAAR